VGAFDGKVGIVTGGASGIGLAAVRRLAEEGATVVVADVAEEAGRQAAVEVDGRFVAADVADPAAWARLVAEAVDELGGLDIAYLNAGVTTRPLGSDADPDFAALTDENYRRIMSVNLDGVVFGVRAVVPAMRERGGGAIVATSSLAGLIAFPPDPIYTLTKHGVIGLVRSLGPQLEASGISINAVCPGIVDTPLVGAEAKEALREVGFPLIPPSQIAAAVVHAVTSGDTGQAYVCQPGRDPERFEFKQVPGPRTAGAEGMRPPNPVRP
jgi:NAD(P)-dependent dehydrogenase (short-subunit alcohol dehydrogenase family)